MQAGSKSQRERQVITRIYRAAYSLPPRFFAQRPGIQHFIRALLSGVEDTYPDGRVTCFQARHRSNYCSLASVQSKNKEFNILGPVTISQLIQEVLGKSYNLFKKGFHFEL